MKNYLAVLEGCMLFRGVEPEEIESILTCMSAEKRTYKKGEYIFRHGMSVTKMAVILEGEVHIRKEDYWGNLSILNHLEEGDVFGEVYAALGGETITSDAVAVKDTRILMMDVSRLLNVCTRSCSFHKKAVANLLFVMAMKNKALTGKLEHMSQRSIREKLSSYLSEQSLKAGSSLFDIPLNRQQLADYLSVDRSALSKELCKMRDDGIIEFNRNNFRLK